MLVITAKMKATKGKEKDTPIYIGHRSIVNPAEFFFYEQYIDGSTYERHRSTLDSKEFLDALPGLVNGNVEVSEYEILESR